MLYRIIYIKSLMDMKSLFYSDIEKSLGKFKKCFQKKTANFWSMTNFLFIYYPPYPDTLLDNIIVVDHISQI